MYSTIWFTLGFIFFMITEKSAQIFNNEIEIINPVYSAVLDKPICILKDYNDNKPEEKYLNFKVFEECKFQLFMDKLKQLDCYNTKYFTCEVEDEDCMKKVFDARYEIYKNRLDIACVCKNPRPIKNSGSLDRLIYLMNLHKNNDKGKVDTLDEYIKCWTDLWKQLQEEVIRKVDDIKNIICSNCDHYANQENCKICEKCELIGKQHCERCSTSC